ncbi:MAG: hypothetical protein JW797_08420, partial [Bradymonadales bacterium]|nr:hypothetical protein [Bradymonadales bacterium]
MSDDRYDIKLLGFPQESGDPVEALHQAFGFSRNRAIALLQRLPVVVKRNATAQEVAQFLHAFSAIGASATVLKGGEQAISSPPGSVELPPERPTVPVTPVEQAALDRFTPFEPATEKPAVPPEPTEDKARAPLVIDRLDDEVPVVSVRPSGEIELIDLPTPEDLPPEVP